MSNIKDAYTCQLYHALKRTTYELSVIRARSGVPFDRDGWESDVDSKYFSDLIDSAHKLLKLKNPFLPDKDPARVSNE